MMRSPLNWTIDLATCCFAWGTFLCADIAWRRDLFMSITVLPEKLPRKFGRAILYLNFALISAFLMFVIYQGAELAWTSRARSFNGIPEVSYSWVTASLPVGAVLMLMTTLVKIRDALREDGILPPEFDPSIGYPMSREGEE